MAIIFLLGPSQWDPEDDVPLEVPPMNIRRQLETIFEEHGHTTILMEDVQDDPSEDLLEKFDRILVGPRLTDIVVYWPRSAKMQTTYDELILLRDRWEIQRLPPIWILHEDRTDDQARCDRRSPRCLLALRQQR